MRTLRDLTDIPKFIIDTEGFHQNQNSRKQSKKSLPPLPQKSPGPKIFLLLSLINIQSWARSEKSTEMGKDRGDEA